MITQSRNDSSSARLNLQWLFVLRNLMIAGESMVILITVYGLGIPIEQDALWAVVGGIVVLNSLTWYRLQYDYPVTELELFVQLALDVVGITALLYFTGGATNPIAWFFLLPLIITATVLPQIYTWYMVVFTSSCYTILIGYYVPLPDISVILPNQDVPLPIERMAENHGIELHVFGMWFGFVFSAGLVAYFVVEMANTIRERDRKLAQAREQTLRDERVIALGTLAAGAAHEMGTPLGTMAILTKELSQEYTEKEFSDLHEKMKILREQVDRCKQALSIMSASAGQMRAESGHTMPVNRYLDEVVEQWQDQPAKVKIRYQAEGVGPPPCILAERTLTHALVNILNNAADVSPEYIEFKGKWDHSQLRLEVIDQGPGLNPALKATLGKMPFTTKEHGLGVGLFLTYATIERLGGKIEMTAPQNGGTCTQIVLPLLPSDNCHEAQIPHLAN